MASSYEFPKCKKICTGAGATTVVGAILYEFMRLKKTVNNFVNTDVCDIDRKRPDYIYIKYHIYRESIRRNEEQAVKHWMIQPIGKWWKSIKHSIAWRLLEVAKSDNHSDRLKAVRQLAQIDHLKDWDYQHLAQICNSRTAISLARNLCDVRWFLPPKQFGALRQPKSLIYDIRQHLLKLKPCACMNYFKANALDNFSILKDYEYTTQVTSTGVEVTKQEYDHLRKVLEAIFHLTRNRDNSRTLIESGILITLMEILKLFHSDVDIRFLISKIMANLSVCHEYDNDFFVTGWVSVLARWMRNPDLRVQVTAAKALANMDSDDQYLNEFETKVYPLYPLQRVRRKHQLDVIFIHGLLGGVFVTWRQKDPKKSDHGLYGKNQELFSTDCQDLFLVGEITTNNSDHIKSTIGGSIAHGKNVGNNDPSWRYGWKTITYTENALISKRPPKKDVPAVSDVATKELIETLQTANELKSEYEVVYPDCPVQASNLAIGPFSVSGDGWLNEDDKNEYTYCWPMDWLPEEYPNIRIIGLNYESSISEWSPGLICPCDKIKSSLHHRSEEFLQTLAVSGVGRDCPVIWVGHSMGGLVAKSIIVQSINSSDPNMRAIGENTRAILFLGTPHKGSPVAKLKQHVEMIFSPSIEVKELQENGAYLLKLHEQFQQSLTHFKKPIQIVSIAEGSPTAITAFKFPMQFVKEESAKLNIGDFYVLNDDHFGLCKPVFRQSFLYQRLLKIINDVITTMGDDEHNN